MAYASWLVASFPIAFDRLTHAVSFLLFEFTVDKILVLVLIVALRVRRPRRRWPCSSL